MKHLDVVAAIIINKGQILCMQRGQAKQEYISGKFEFPGGKIEAGETRTEAPRVLPILRTLYYLGVVINEQQGQKTYRGQD